MVHGHEADGSRVGNGSFCLLSQRRALGLLPPHTIADRIFPAPSEKMGKLTCTKYFADCSADPACLNLVWISLHYTPAFL